MTIWWPWRKTKSVLSLFKERVLWWYEEPNAPPFRMPPQKPFSEEPHPKNAAGPFYVCHGWCMGCGFPHSLAPDLIAAPEEQRDTHCFFKKQPETADEIERAIRAIAGACCGAFRYAGKDEGVRKKIREIAGDDRLVNG
jgi:hypothetical protein